MKIFTAGRVALVLVWLATMVAAMATGVYVHKHRAKIRALLSSVQNDPAITTNLNVLRIQKMTVPGGGRDGGIAALDDGILFANRFGEVWFIGADRSRRKLEVVIPINNAEFQADPFNANTLYQELFGIKDIALQTLPTGLRVLAAHSHWNREGRCNTLRVSSLETTREALLSGGSGTGSWRTLFETAPCRPLESTPGGKQRMGLGAGGRIGVLPDGSILLTVGGFDPENELVLIAPQKLDNSYGKTIRINPETGASRIFTIGHRNPQGLAVASDGRIWLTEHSARGGDELNHLTDGGNYGYPHVSYGTQYDAMTWPLSTAQGRHDGYDKPAFVWVPSIATSQLVVLESSRFPHWKGDLIVSTLAAQSLFRVRVEDERVMFVEPIPIGHRIRDIIEANDGTIVLLTDDDFLVYIEPLDAESAATPTERGAILAAPCQGCHGMTPESGAGIGPSLWNVVGRSIASAGDFTYSAGLSAVDGNWTPAALRQFLTDPNAFAPGTTMALPTPYDESELADLIAYLQTLK